MRKILILGGYGNFGKRIAAALLKKGIPIIIAGRDAAKAQKLTDALASPLAETAVFDVTSALDKYLKDLNPSVVINTCGPFQNSDYSVAQSCIRHGVHYIDLADGRDFVKQISVLNEEARKAGVCVISGASTVPGISSAVVEQFLPEFKHIDSMTYGISPGQRAERGLATTQGILSYVGKPLRHIAGEVRKRYGWQDIYRQEYPEIGKRWMANCDIPDLDLLPSRYEIKRIRFSAGLELGILHLGLWALSWLVRAGIPIKLQRLAKPLLASSNVFNRFGSANGGMHVILKGEAKTGSYLEKQWFIIARDGNGPNIPTIPAIILAEKLHHDELLPSGAQACVGLVTLENCMLELRDFSVKTYQETGKVTSTTMGR